MGACVSREEQREVTPSPTPSSPYTSQSSQSNGPSISDASSELSGEITLQFSETGIPQHSVDSRDIADREPVINLPVEDWFLKMERFQAYSPNRVCPGV